MEEKSKAGKPLIHCITNPIAMTQTANAILALGARPIMAEHPLEVEEITETASALLLNFGNISDIRIESMKKSLKVADENKIPVVLDVVGVACSKLRRDFFQQLMTIGTPTVIKGNYSEILALSDDSYFASGVDSQEGLEQSAIENAAKQLAKKYNTAVLATGNKDLLATNKAVTVIEGGCPQLGTVTGTGCMLGGIIATFLAFNPVLTSVEKASSFFKECGRRAATTKGSGTFMVNLMDRIGEYDGF